MAVSSTAVLLFRILLARQMPSPSDVGTVSAGLAIVLIAVPVASLGIPQAVLAIDGGGRRFSYQVALKWVAGGLLAVSAAVIVWTLLRERSATGVVAVLLLPLLAVYVLADLASAAMQISGRYRRIAATRALPGLVILLPSSVVLLSSEPRPVAVASAISAASVAMVVVLVWRSVVNPPGFSERPDSAQRGPAPSLLSVSWPYALYGAAYMTYYQVDLVLLDHFWGPGTTGLYAIAVTVNAGAYMVLGAVFANVLQHRIHIEVASHEERVWRSVVAITSATALSGLGIALAIAVLAPWIVAIVFGPAYQSAVPIVRVLSIAVAATYAAVPAGSVLNALGDIRAKSSVAVLMGALNVAGNIVAIPRYGAMGAAWMTVLSQIGVAFLYIALVIARYRPRRGAFHRTRE